MVPLLTDVNISENVIIKKYTTLHILREKKLQNPFMFKFSKKNNILERDRSHSTDSFEGLAAIKDVATTNKPALHKTQYFFTVKLNSKPSFHRVHAGFCP